MHSSKKQIEQTPLHSRSIKVIVVEDDASLRTDLVDFLNGRNVATYGVKDGEALWRTLKECTPELLVVDIILPGDNGLTLVRKARAAGFSGGIIILSAVRESNHMVTGYGNGADVYLTKDADLDVIEACIRRLLEKSAVRDTTDTTKGWCLDMIRRNLSVAQGDAVKLTAKELSILAALMASPGCPQDRNKLLGIDRALTFDEQRSIDAAISRLKRKVRAETGLPLPIDHVYAVGYVFSDLAEIVDVDTTR